MDERYYFPYETIREHQDTLLEQVTEVIASKKDLIVHAPTGIGKTAAALGPAIKYAIEHEKTVLFLTSRHTQHLIALETVKMIKKRYNLSFHVSDIVGKRHMCLQQGAGLMYSSDFFEFCKQLRESGKCEYYSKARKTPTTLTPGAEGLVAELGSMADSDAETVKSICDNNSMCPYEIAIDLAKKARVIICDYNYAFDPVVRSSLMKKAEIEIEDCIIIVDEGHNLPSRSRNIFTSKLSSFVLKRAIKEAKKFEKDKLITAFTQILQSLHQKSQDLLVGNEKKVSMEEIKSMVALHYNFDDLIDDCEEASEDIREEQKQSYIASVGNFFKMWKKTDEGHLRYIAKQKFLDEEGINLVYRCLDPSLLTKGTIGDSHSTILMSGTLTPTEMYRDLLGFPSQTKMLVLDSPFPKKNKLSIIVPKTTTQYKKRSPEMFKEIAMHLANITNSIPGNSAIFFPSYSIMSMVYTYYHELAEKTVFKESNQLSKLERKQMLGNFEKYKNSGAVLLGVASGSFGEGIDYMGDMLKAVIVVGVPLQRPDLETKELINYYDSKFGKGWEYAYISPAFSKTLQNAGRCIRSENDRGIIVFLDERFTWPSYIKHFPPDEELKISLDYKNLIRDFFAEK